MFTHTRVRPRVCLVLAYMKEHPEPMLSNTKEHQESYEAPKLTRFGTFRDLTLQGVKRSIGDDLVPGIGMDCDNSAPSGDPAACLRS